MFAAPVVTLTRESPAQAAVVRASPAAAWAGVIVLVIAVPFEATAPMIALPGQSISSAECVLLAVLTGWVVSAWRTRRMPPLHTPLTAAWVVLLATWLVAAILAPSFRANALNMWGRLAMACAVFLLTVDGVSSWRRLRSFAVAAAAAGTGLGALVLLDYAGAGPSRDLLSPFRPFVAHVGAQVRASGPFLYPTIASMYLEVLFALALPLFAIAIDQGRRWAAIGLAGALLVVAQATVLTFTRAGLITLATSLAFLAAIRLRRSGIDRVVAGLGALAAAIAVEAAASRSLDALVLRLTSEGTESWYSARIDAPAAFDMPTGGLRTVRISVVNTGRVTWDSSSSPPFRLSYHWLTADGTKVVSWEGRRTAFPAPVPPGGRVSLVAEIGAPRQPGVYRVLWDVEHQGRLWFSTEPDARLALSTATVSGPSLGPAGPLAELPRPLSEGAMRPGRRVLWTTALSMWADHPLTGVGPDNYRLRYGEYLGLASPDTRLHSNSLYVEILAGTGLMGVAAGAFFLWRVVRLLVDGLERTSRVTAAAGADRLLLASGVAAAVLAILVHGLVDAFLSFTATYVLIAIVLGLTVSLHRVSGSHADRL